MLEFEDFERTSIPFTVHLDEDPICLINKFQVDRLNSLYGSMLLEENLCDEFGSSVAAEFEFLGNRMEVLKQLKKLLDFRITNPYTEMDRELLKNELNRLNNYNNQIYNNPIRVAVRELNKKYWTDSSPEIFEKIDSLKEQLKINHKTKHSKKECLCFCNY